MDVKISLNSPAHILRDHGLNKNGDAQRFHTANVLRRIQKYMPYRSGATIKLTIAQTDVNVPVIVTHAPYAQSLFEGVAPSGRPLRYTKTKNPLAGPRWDRAVSAAEGDAMAADLQRYLKRKGG